jgi:hypothetical protein
MLYYTRDNKVYNNRKELRMLIGINEYKREVKRGAIIFLNDNKE